MLDVVNKIQLVNRITQYLIQNNLEFYINIDKDNDYFIHCKYKGHNLTFFIGVVRSWWFTIIECNNISFGKLTVSDDSKHYLEYVKVTEEFVDKINQYEQREQESSH